MPGARTLPLLCVPQVREYEVPSERALGPILLIRLHKEPYSVFPESTWYCNTVRVTSPEGDTYRFPCYRWIQGYCTVELVESTGMTHCGCAWTPGFPFFLPLVHLCGSWIPTRPWG